MPWGKVGVFALLLILIAVTAHLLLNRDREASRRGVAEEPVASSQAAEAKETASEPDGSADRQIDLHELEGRWRRTDASYEIEIKEIKADGSMQAAYYNPSPIHVSNAKATEEEGTATVFIELRDVGYPGCTYDLVYDAEQDRLQGIYFQAAQQQRYPVEFVRQ
ncbi:MAG: hypothetical protein ACC628_00950 [Pirellulaceae bacterium]